MKKSSQRNGKTTKRHATAAAASVESDTRFSNAGRQLPERVGTNSDQAMLSVIIGFWSHNLAINSASLQLAYDGNMAFDGFSGGKFVVHVFSELMSPEQAYDTTNPLCKRLSELLNIPFVSP